MNSFSCFCYNLTKKQQKKIRWIYITTSKLANKNKNKNIGD